MEKAKSILYALLAAAFYAVNVPFRFAGSEPLGIVSASLQQQEERRGHLGAFPVQ